MFCGVDDGSAPALHGSRVQQLWLGAGNSVSAERMRSGCELILASNRRVREPMISRGVAAGLHQDSQQFSLRVGNFVSIDRGRQDRICEFTDCRVKSTQDTSR